MVLPQKEIDTRSQGSDRYILMAVVILLSFGLLAVYSSIAFFAQNNDTSAFEMITRHLVKIGIAVVVILLGSKVNYHTIAKFSRPLMVVSLLLLVMVLVFGEEQFGAKRWLSIGGFGFQPSTVAAVSLIIHVSVLLNEKQNTSKTFNEHSCPLCFGYLSHVLLLESKIFLRLVYLWEYVLFLCLLDELV